VRTLDYRLFVTYGAAILRHWRPAMGRNRTSIPFYVPAWIEIVEKRTKLSGLARYLGVSRQTINGWKERKRIPPRMLIEITSLLNLTPEETEMLILSPEKLLKELVQSRKEIERLNKLQEAQNEN
jgi:transcriptional regulator with XRE-family HTH domain